MDHVNKGIPKLVFKNQVDDKIEINYEQIYRICFQSCFYFLIKLARWYRNTKKSSINYLSKY